MGKVLRDRFGAILAQAEEAGEKGLVPKYMRSFASLYCRTYGRKHGERVSFYDDIEALATQGKLLVFEIPVPAVSKWDLAKMAPEEAATASKRRVMTAKYVLPEHADARDVMSAERYAKELSSFYTEE